VNPLSAPHRKIRNLINPVGSRRALVVEGDDDKVFIERQLDMTHPGWRAKWVVGSATGKTRVLDILDLEPTWLGLVDAEEWDSSTIAQLTTKLTGLQVLPRYCMESYYILPREIWPLLTQSEQSQITGGYPVFESAILAPLAAWVRHGVLWQVVNPLWAGLRAKGFKDALLDITAAQSDQFIQAKLQEWDAYLDSTALFNDFQTRLAAANSPALPNEQKLATLVHGKSFFRTHVSMTLNQFLKPLNAEPAEYWLTELMKNSPAHADFIPLWTAMQLP
jgi:hypothetical protein